MSTKKIKKVTDTSIIFKKRLKMQFFGYCLLAHSSANVIFLLKIAKDISNIWVKYLTLANTGWDLPMIDEYQKF